LSGGDARTRKNRPKFPGEKMGAHSRAPALAFDTVALSGLDLSSLKIVMFSLEKMRIFD
jgi:hypothetical protein